MTFMVVICFFFIIYLFSLFISAYFCSILRYAFCSALCLKLIELKYTRKSLTFPTDTLHTALHLHYIVERLWCFPSRCATTTEGPKCSCVPNPRTALLNRIQSTQFHHSVPQSALLCYIWTACYNSMWFFEWIGNLTSIAIILFNSNKKSIQINMKKAISHGQFILFLIWVYLLSKQHHFCRPLNFRSESKIHSCVAVSIPWHPNADEILGFLPFFSMCIEKNESHAMMKAMVIENNLQTCGYWKWLF